MWVNTDKVGISGQFRLVLMSGKLLGRVFDSAPSLIFNKSYCILYILLDILGGQSNYATLASWKISQRTISSEALPEFILQIVRKN
jgi:hypothetical protein